MIYLFHGLIGDADHYLYVAEKLCAKGYRVCVPDLDFQTYDVEYYRRMFQDRIDAEGTPTILVGNSIGCLLATQLQAEQVGYVLTAPPFDYSNNIVPLGRGQSEAYIKTLYSNHGNIRNETQFLRSATIKLDQMMSDRRMIKRVRSLKAQSLSFLTQNRLPRLASRIRFVIGADDFTTPITDFKQFVRSKTPKAGLSVLKGCGHAIPVEKPTLLANIIAKQAMKIGITKVNQPMRALDSIQNHDSALVF